MTVLGHRGQRDWQAAGKACFQAMAGPSIIASVWYAGTGHSFTHSLILESGDSLWRLCNALVFARSYPAESANQQSA